VADRLRSVLLARAGAGVVATVPVAAAPVATTYAAPTTIAFVGEQLALHELPTPCSATEVQVEAVADGADCVLQYEFAARYRVVRELAGRAPATELELRFADRYGFPRFAEFRHALLVVTVAGDVATLQKYQGYEVFPTADGDWATCGAPFGSGANGPAPEPLEFAESAVVEDVRERSPAWIAARYADARYVLADGVVRCRLGVRVQALLQALRVGVLRARGVELAPAVMAEPVDPSKGP
jgi:hypothetical protein